MGKGHTLEPKGVLNLQQVNKTIPPVLVDTLKEFSLRPTSLLQLDVQIVTRVGTTRYAVVRGVLPDLPTKPPAVVYGLLFEVVKDAGLLAEQWTVAPTAIKSVGHTNVVVSRLVSRTVEKKVLPLLPAPPTSPVQNSASGSSPPSYATSSIDGSWLKGPYSYIRRSAWMELTDKGCSVCGKVLYPASVAEIGWEGEKPICELCVKKGLTPSTLTVKADDNLATGVN
jgi:hypothetical protein